MGVQDRRVGVKFDSFSICTKMCNNVKSQKPGGVCSQTFYFLKRLWNMHMKITTMGQFNDRKRKGGLWVSADFAIYKNKDCCVQSNQLEKIMEVKIFSDTLPSPTPSESPSIYISEFTVIKRSPVKIP